MLDIKVNRRKAEVAALPGCHLPNPRVCYQSETI